MTATVIRLWSGPHEHRIRIPGPGEQLFDAKVIPLPVLNRRRATKPPRQPKPLPQSKA